MTASTSARSSLTELLQNWSDGDRAAADQALPLVYDELHRIANALFRRERRRHTLQATALVHEAFLQLSKQPGLQWRSRTHFLGFAAHVMRRVLVVHARERRAQKRGGGMTRVTLDDASELGLSVAPDLIALDQALHDLEQVDPRKTAIVELRFFGGLTIDESATLLGVSPVTVSREWRKARAWLYRQLVGKEAIRPDPSTVRSTPHGES